VGVDVPNVRFVVHIGGSHSLLDYLQETGRAGRDGKPALAVTITTPTFLDFLGSEGNASEIEKFWEYLDNKGCSQQFLARYLGSEITCCLAREGDECCINCANVAKAAQNQDHEGKSVWFVCLGLWSL